MTWLRRLLENTETVRKKALLFSHIPPRFFNTGTDFEKILPSYKCVKSMFCGHTHRNTLHHIGDIPVMERVGNAMSPLGYSMIHPFPNGRPDYEAVITARETRDGHLYIARRASEWPGILARSWFNIRDGIAYRLRTEVRDGSIRFMG